MVGSRGKKPWGYLLLAFTAIAVALLFWLHTVYPLDYIYRVLAWQDADYNDYQRFPARLIEKAERPFRFRDAGRQDATAAIFEQDPRIDDLERFLEDTHTTAFVVVKDADLLYEGYFNGHSRDSIQSSFSVAKSLLSMLVGIALKDQRIQSLKDPITDYLPELEDRDPGFARITIENLLTMRSGLEYSRAVEFPFVNADGPKTYYHPDLRSVALKETRIVAEPATRFLYNNYNALLVGLILERAVGTSVSKYLEEKVWQRIGAEYDATWSLDNNGFEKMESGFNARAIDFAKVGRLFLNDGMWAKAELVPEQWVEESTQLGPRDPGEKAFDARNWYYKYFWWGIPRTDAPDDFVAIGRFGQFIFVSQATDVVIVRNGPASVEFDDPDWTELFHSVADRL